MATNEAASAARGGFETTEDYLIAMQCLDEVPDHVPEPSKLRLAYDLFKAIATETDARHYKRVHNIQAELKRIDSDKKIKRKWGVELARGCTTG